MQCYIQAETTDEQEENESFVRAIDFIYTLPEFNGNLATFGGSQGGALSIVIAHLPVSQSIAINGTLYPIHETKGIAHSIFDGTLQGLNEQTLQKFQRRMCGSIADYKTFQTISPQRPMEELKEELAAIQQQYLSLPPSDFKWQKAIIGKGDRIFLPDNQYLAWENQVDSLEQVEAAHYQQELFNTILMQPEN